jgi:fructose-1,6-bisphosphatase/inositol monophosphatase family enzyme
MPLVDPLRVTEIIRETAQEVILPRFRHLAAGDIREKGPGDLVTIADTEAEQILTRRLTELLPGSCVVGEEAAAADASVLDRLAGSAPVWIIDPVDGTSNFAHGRKHFAVIVALVVEGRTVQGWIHDPLNDSTAIAAIGEGVWIGERRLTVPADAPVHSLIGTVGGRKVEALTKAVGKLIRHGSAAHDYLALIDGRLHFAYFRRLRPWDHAAGVLMHGEAGGYSAMMDGTPYRPFYTESSILLTPGRQTWCDLAGLLA